MKIKILTGFLCISLLMACQKKESNESVYDFRLESFDHQRFYMNRYQGTPLVLVFWATYCNICKLELTQLNDSLSKFRAKGIEVVSVVIDPENKSDLKEIAERLKLSFPILLDQNQKVFNRFRLKVLPSTLIIASNGKIVFSVEGYDAAIQERIYKQAGIH